MKAQAELYDAYSARINSSYPAFLKRLNLHHCALRAEGAVITDAAGRSYLDCVGGFGIQNFGHNHPLIIEALLRQIHGNPLSTGPLITEVQVEAAAKLTAMAPGGLDCCFFLNSGSEAVDCALKLARLCTRKNGIVTLENSFHGHTFGALSASGIRRFKAGFGRLLEGIKAVPAGDIKALERAVTTETAAVLIEPVQHEAGIHVPTFDYMNRLRTICDERGCLLIFDEVKTGFGKTGRLFACEHFEVVPDILILGKSMGGGLIPAGGIVARQELWKKFSMSFPMSASSYAGNGLLCAVVLQTLSFFEDPTFMEQVRRKAEVLTAELQVLRAEFPELVHNVAGLGLLIGVETASGTTAMTICRKMAGRGVLVFPAFGKNSVLMIEPPLVITNEQIVMLCAALAASLQEIKYEHSMGLTHENLQELCIE